MTGQKVKENILKIADMTLQEVEDYRVKISTSSASRRAKVFLYRACEERLKDIDTTQAMAVNGDIDDIN